ncbi:MAG: BlaI/MecI/CopY family transcriptional regulator [Planctomycetota bacterium]|jgi:predicted transcriptional regulator
MSRKSLDDLGRLQRAVIETVWELGEASVHEVRQKLGQKKKLAYTTVLTAMQKLEQAGWLRHRNEGKSYVYLPTRTREEAGAMFQHLIRESKLSDNELTELRKMIDKKRKENKK